MSKLKVIYTCQTCGAIHPKWAGQCSDCGTWNSLIEELSDKKSVSNLQGPPPKIQRLNEIDVQKETRINTGINEFDRVLGGGLVIGSVVLIGGDPGIGKSTLVIQALNSLSKNLPGLYVTGEESPMQVAMRANRLGLNAESLQLLAETSVEKIIHGAEILKPQVIVIDSIQTIYTENLSSAPGSVSQIRESTAQLINYAKQNNSSLLIIGHVTKEGVLAGPRVLEHMVDCVLYFEGSRDNRYRIVRAVKNRFGAVNELGVFAMTDSGLREISNPSAIFLSRSLEPIAGSIITATWEGTRPLLIELQALVDQSYMPNPRRITVGLEQNRLAMLLAVLNRHAQIRTYDQDVFVNIVGGVKISETATDLALLLAIISSLKNKPLPMGLVAFGEVGLSGEIRPVQNGQDRLKEAAKHGFKTAIIPFANAPKKPVPGIKTIAVSNLKAALDEI
jgi:DNA repair protein RadA/Sms